MAKQRTEMDLEIEKRTAGWVTVNRHEDPLEWAAWTKWRKENLDSKVEFETMTVPGPLPPITVAAAKEYIETVRMMRSMAGWRRGAAKLTKDPSAWMGG